MGQSVVTFSQALGPTELPPSPGTARGTSWLENFA